VAYAAQPVTVCPPKALLDEPAHVSSLYGITGAVVHGNALEEKRDVASAAAVAYPSLLLHSCASFPLSAEALLARLSLHTSPSQHRAVSLISPQAPRLQLLQRHTRERLSCPIGADPVPHESTARTPASKSVPTGRAFCPHLVSWILSSILCHAFVVQVSVWSESTFSTMINSAMALSREPHIYREVH